MPRYYFNVCSDEFEATDVVGERCADDIEALSEAMRKASEVVRSRLASDGHPAFGWVEVEDERHRPVLKLPLAVAAY